MPNPFALLDSDTEDNTPEVKSAPAKKAPAAAPAKQSQPKKQTQQRGRGGRSGGRGVTRQTSAGDPNFNSDDRGAVNRSNRRYKGGNRDDRKAKSNRSHDVEKKSGHGTWGTTEDAVANAEDELNNKPVEDPLAEDGEAVEVEEPDNSMTLEEFLASKAGSNTAAPVRRKANDGDEAAFKGSKQLERKGAQEDDEDDEEYEQRAQRSHRKVAVDVGFRVASNAGGDRRGRGRGGRGRGRGGRGRGGRDSDKGGRGGDKGGRGRGRGRGGRGRGGSKGSLKVDDTNFPSLG